MKVGDVLVEKTTRTVFYLVTRDRTNKSSLDNLANYFTKLKEICSHKNIIILAFPKHGMGLDKLCWTDVENLIKKTFSEEIKCTIYTNAIAIQENTSDLDLNTKIKILQTQGVMIISRGAFGREEDVGEIKQ